MSRRKQPKRSSQKKKRRCKPAGRTNKAALFELLQWSVLVEELFSKDTFHGNIKWKPEELAAQAVIWSWQESKNVTDAFDQALEICRELGLRKVAQTYPSFMNGLRRYTEILNRQLRTHYQEIAEEVGGAYFCTDGWVLIGFDGSRATAPRTVSNEKAFCAPNYGHGKRAKYGKKKSQGLRRKRNLQNPPQPQAPQAWITLMWHMGLRLPWTWRLGPSNSSERDHVRKILKEESFPESTLFCGDAGFTGYPLWSVMTTSRNMDFLIRIGANVKLLSEHADIKKKGGGIVLCWPKGQMDSGAPPLRLRLVQIKIGKTKMWMLTSVMTPTRLSKKQIVRYYKMRWGIEVEFRGLKQTIDKHTLRSRTSDRLLVELDWSIRGMAYAELLAIREQLASTKTTGNPDTDYDPRDRSLANTMRALRASMRNLNEACSPENDLFHELSQARVQRYRNRTDKKARYRPKNPDKKPLGNPTVRRMNDKERKRFKQYQQQMAA